ncbi:hypothetical protein BC342_18765 [Streptomyces olivaceus]|nr:hypothetical protein BC342_18765 [Streptomyces olivaceus]
MRGLLHHVVADEVHLFDAEHDVRDARQREVAVCRRICSTTPLRASRITVSSAVVAPVTCCRCTALLAPGPRPSVSSS